MYANQHIAEPSDIEQFPMPKWWTIEVLSPTAQKKAAKIANENTFVAAQWCISGGHHLRGYRKSRLELLRFQMVEIDNDWRPIMVSATEYWMPK